MGVLSAMSRRTERARRAVDLAETLLREARAQETPDEIAQARRLARMIADPRGKQLTIALIDQAFRSRRPARIADQISYLLERYGAPQFMEWWERVGLMLGGVMAHYLPSVVVPPIVARLRHETQSLILPAEEEELQRYVAERRGAGIRLNLNLLGEAILGEGEAARRLEAYLALLAREDVEYISVKVSSVFSQLNLVAFDATKGYVKERLRARAARHGVSMEEEAREILKTGVAQSEETCENWVKALRRRVAAVGGVDLPIPPRSPMREPPDFGE